MKPEFEVKEFKLEFAPLSLAIGNGPGCLSVKVHAGSYPASNGITTIGTDDPAIWHHLLWFDGEVWAARLFSDVLRHIPTYEELRSHFDQWKDDTLNPWRRVMGKVKS